jgi:hypothetical protein
MSQIENDGATTENASHCSVELGTLLAIADLLGKAWLDRSKNPLAADVSLLGALRKVRSVLEDSGNGSNLSGFANDAIRFADELHRNLDGSPW